jgi:predicted permease
MQKGKQAARGQKLINEENKSTILHYSLASICSLVLVGSLNLFLFRVSTATWVLYMTMKLIYDLCWIFIAIILGWMDFRLAFTNCCSGGDVLND